MRFKNIMFFTSHVPLQRGWCIFAVFLTMKYKTHFTTLLATLSIFLIVPQHRVSAETETYLYDSPYSASVTRWNNDNWFIVDQPHVNMFTVLDDGTAYGMTNTDIPFKQYTIPNTIGARIQRFEIQDHYHYIIDGEVVYSLEDFSIQLAQAYNATLL